MSKPRIVIFAYNFKHKKTQDFLFRLFAEGVAIEAIIAADPVELNIPASSIRTKIRHSGLLHPRIVAKAINSKYIECPHQGKELNLYLDKLKPDIGIISGARILRNSVISRFSKGIINFHPGLIPEARGLDAMLWSINDGIPLGVTSHLIDSRVDAGLVLEKREIDLFFNDTLFDLSERLYETQLDMLMKAIYLTSSNKGEPVNYGECSYNRKMPEDIEKTILAKLPNYLERFSKK